MNNPFHPCVGGTLSADIAVPEHEREVRFYSRVLTTGDRPLWRDDLMNDRGMPIIGLGARTEEYADLPLQWMPHIQVADVAASAAVAVELGGRELMHGKDDDGTSQWAVLLDPDGAAFGIIPVVSPEALAVGEGTASGDASRAGCIAWIELTVADASTAREFYRRVVGWSVQEIDMDDADERYADFTMVGGDGPAASIRHARGENSALPAAWLIHLPVGDLDESLRRVRADGGTVVMTTPGAGDAPPSAVIRDPVGACLALVQG